MYNFLKVDEILVYNVAVISHFIRRKSVENLTFIAVVRCLL